jgi:hypothetical protein
MVAAREWQPPISQPGGKRCGRCKKWKDPGAFRPDLKARTGLSSWCRDCIGEYRREWRATNPERTAAYNVARRVAACRLKCAVCDSAFFGRPDRKTCSPECRREHKRRLDTQTSWPKKMDLLEAPAALETGSPGQRSSML